MSEKFGSFKAGGKRYEMTPDNTSVYLHMGELAVFDHLFTTMETYGAYIWRDSKSFEDLVELATDAGCALHVNLRKVSELDERVYMQQATSDLGDTMPENW